jgi:hypothetical protein
MKEDHGVHPTKLLRDGHDGGYEGELDGAGMVPLRRMSRR